MLDQITFEQLSVRERLVSPHVLVVPVCEAHLKIMLQWVGHLESWTELHTREKSVI